MEMTFKNYKYKDNLLNFTIEKSKINGITGKDTEELVRIINLKNTYRGKIIIDQEELTKDNVFVVPLKKGLRFAVCAVSEEKCAIAPSIIKNALNHVLAKG